MTYDVHSVASSQHRARSSEVTSMTAMRVGAVSARMWRASVMTLALLAASLVWAQSSWHVDVLVPDVVTVRVPTTHIAFAISIDDYPPAAFPARYAATTPEGGVLPVQVFSNAQGPWSLLLQVPDLAGEQGQGGISPDHVLYRVDGGLWQRASAVPQVIFVGSGPTADWRQIDVEFAIELTGTETAGRFAVDAYLTGSGSPGAP
ncbi:MAG: hypothetical protein P8Z81_08525 [Deinococcales bacterium]